VLPIPHTCHRKCQK